MRLIDADKLQAKHYLQRTEHPIGYEGTQAVYDYTDVLAYDIESAEIVEAIPIEWLKNKSKDLADAYWNNVRNKLVLDMKDLPLVIDEIVRMWEKENE